VAGPGSHGISTRTPRKGVHVRRAVLLLECRLSVSHIRANVVFVGYHYKQLRIHDERSKFLYAQSRCNADCTLGEQALRARAPIQTFGDEESGIPIKSSCGAAKSVPVHNASRGAKTKSTRADHNEPWGPNALNRRVGLRAYKTRSSLNTKEIEHRTIPGSSVVHFHVSTGAKTDGHRTQSTR
jgi:hypothetical protein